LGDPEIKLVSCNQPNGFVANQDDPCDDVAFGWDVIGAIFENDGCTGCHGNGMSGGLDLRTYDTAILGGNKCGSGIITGTNLVGVITETGYSGCGQAISGANMNQRVGGNIDSQELAMIQAWIDSGAQENCDCQPGEPDSDGDGLCDELDNCPGFDNNLIGTNCNDGNVCTINDTYAVDCNCVGIPALDTDNDGVCDAEDAMPLNPCTADGTIDGIEAYPWIGSESNDCDNDGIILAQGDFDDFSPCIDNFGYLTTVACQCGPAALTAGGLLDTVYGTIVNANRANGMPDGLTTNFIGFNDTLSISYPHLQKGDEICVTFEFTDINGVITIDLNRLGKYRIENTAGLNYKNFVFRRLAMDLRQF